MKVSYKKKRYYERELIIFQTKLLSSYDANTTVIWKLSQPASNEYGIS